jgi:adenylate cyclase
MQMGAAQFRHTFLFADLCGFTALTEAHGDDHAADLAQAFSRQLRELLPAYRAQEIKSLGDGMMIRTPNPAGAIRLATRIVWEIGGSSGITLARAGVHTGPAAERAGDWYGGAVNIAARLCEIAQAHEALVTDATRRAAGQLSELSLEHLGELPLRNLSAPATVYRVWPSAETTEMPPVDPVCRMVVKPGRKVALGAHGNGVYAFCSVACAAAFASAPERYVADQRSVAMPCGPAPTRSVRTGLPRLERIATRPAP